MENFLLLLLLLSQKLYPKNFFGMILLEINNVVQSTQPPESSKENIKRKLAVFGGEIVAHKSPFYNLCGHIYYC